MDSHERQGTSSTDRYRSDGGRESNTNRPASPSGSRSAQGRTGVGDTQGRTGARHAAPSVARPVGGGARHFSTAASAPAHRGVTPKLLAGVLLTACIVIIAIVVATGAFEGSNVGAFSGASNSGDGGAAVGTVGSDADGSDGADGTAASSAQPVDINLVAIGDVLQHRGVFESGQQSDGSYNFDHIFSHIAGQLDGADVKVLNQESVLGGSIAPYSGYPSFNGPQEMGDAEAKVGFNVVLRASNHSMDMGYAGLHSELSFWHTKHPEVAVIGAVDPEDSSASVDDVYVFEKDGFKVALLNYTFDLNGYEDPQGDVSMLQLDHVRKTMEAARQQADMVVVFPHWGEEYHTEPVDSQRQWEQEFINDGADVIIGGHPHVIEPVDTFERTNGGTGVCFWSVGNYISTQTDNSNLVCGMAKVTLHKDADGTCSVSAAEMDPMVTHKGTGQNMTTYMLADYTNELAQTNGWGGVYNTTLTPSWAQLFCSQVLGSSYDPTTCSLRVDLSQPASGSDVAYAGDATVQENAA